MISYRNWHREAQFVITNNNTKVTQRSDKYESGKGKDMKLKETEKIIMGRNVAKNGYYKSGHVKH